MFARPLTRAVDFDVPVRHSYLLVSLLTFLVAFLIKPASIFVTFWLRWQMSSPWWWRLPDRPGDHHHLPPIGVFGLDWLLLFLRSLLNPGCCCGSHDVTAWSSDWPQRAMWCQTCSISLLRPVLNTDLFNDNKLETTKELGGDIKSLKKRIIKFGLNGVKVHPPVFPGQVQQRDFFSFSFLKIFPTNKNTQTKDF